MVLRFLTGLSESTARARSVGRSRGTVVPRRRGTRPMMMPCDHGTVTAVVTVMIPSHCRAQAGPGAAAVPGRQGRSSSDSLLDAAWTRCQHSFQIHVQVTGRTGCSTVGSDDSDDPSPALPTFKGGFRVRTRTAGGQTRRPEKGDNKIGEYAGDRLQCHGASARGRARYTRDSESFCFHRQVS